MAKIKIHLAQVNTSVGDINGNAAKILQEYAKAGENNCDLAVFCEMTLSGYPCQDLWLKKYFIYQIEEKLSEIIAATRGQKCAILLGAPTISTNRTKKEIIHNSAILIADGKVIKVANKKTLPNYGVFDEKRFFESENYLSLVEFKGFTLAILICEDLWDAKNLFLLKEQVLDAVITLNSSPYAACKHIYREKIISNFAKTLAKPLIYVNQVGAQDSIVFDGGSFVLNENGSRVLQLGEFVADSATCELEKTTEKTSVISEITTAKDFNILQRNYSAVVLGLRDYIQKSGFKKVLLGMSGGIDSALVAVIAVDALGSENVALYVLPSRYNSDQSMIDAKECAKNLGLDLQVISIEPAFTTMLGMIKSQKESDLLPLTQENLQSRIRGNILMALSNDSGALLLSTGNKSELATGYATLYGDMCGAFNPLKDLYKTEVFALAKWRNQNICALSLCKKTALIPQNIITKEPTAELRDNQKDSDNLPPYEILDKILQQLIEEQKSVADIIKSGFEEDVVKKVAKLFYASEYKRNQAVIGVKLTNMSFDKDRRYPIVNKFWE